MNSSPSTYPTTSDISMFMRELGYEWSNQVQTYFNYDFEYISGKQAEKMYEKIIGNKPFKSLK